MHPYVAERTKNLRFGRHLTSNGQVSVFTVAGQKFTMLSPHRRDYIQRSHRNGRLYEEQDLRLIERHFPRGGVFLDIGSNVGNHSVFVGVACGAGRIIPVEPNRAVVDVLIDNLVLNGLEDRCDFRFIGFGFGETEATGLSMDVNPRNLGGARFHDAPGDIEVLNPERALGAQTVDFVKIDVEGLELEVLRGIGPVLRRDRPAVYIEIWNTHFDGFKAWVDDNGYRIVETLRHQKEYANHLLLPQE